MLAKLARLSGGNAFSQLLNFIAISYVSRIIGPEEYGNYALIVSLSLIITAFVTLKGDNIIYSCVNTQDINEAAINLVGFISRVVAILISISLIVACIDTDFGSVIFLSSLLGFLNAIIVISSAYFIQLDKIASHLKLLVIRPVLMFLIQAGLVFISQSYVLLCIGKLISDSYVAFTRLKFTPVYSTSSSITSIKKFIIKYKSYCFYGTSASVLNIFNQQLALIASTIIYNSYYTGHLGLALSLVIAPIGVILSPLRGLFIKKVSQKKPTLSNYILYTSLLGILAIITYLLAYSVTPYIVSQLWGSTWPYLTEVVICLIIWPLSSLFSSYGYAVIIANGKQKSLLNIEFIYLLVRVLVIFYCFLYSVDFMTYVFAFTTIGLTYNLAILYIGFKEVVNRKYLISKS